MSTSRISLSYRLSIATRIFVAAVGGYFLTSLLVAAVAVLAPLDPSEATLAATMLSFAIYAGIAVIVFSIRSVWRMVAYMAAAFVVVRAALWACDRLGWG